jgi:protein regulator of cytokinesis 1
MSPEDVYDDRERMSYMSTSQLNHNRQYHHDFHSSMQHSGSVPSLANTSRQTSNTSSNLTTGTTATGSENWETFSDASELEPERYDHYGKPHAANGMRVIGTHNYGHMAPPPKRRMHERIDEGDENSKTIVMADREPSWSTETEETY